MLVPWMWVLRRESSAGVIRGRVLVSLSVVVGRGGTGAGLEAVFDLLERVDELELEGGGRNRWVDWDGGVAGGG